MFPHKKFLRKMQLMKLSRRRKPRKVHSEPISTSISGELTNSNCNITCSKRLDSKRRREIIAEYGRILKKHSSCIERETDLPFPKDLIRQAIYEELLENPENELTSHLEIAFAQLEAFLPDHEYHIMQQFKLTGNFAESLAKSGNPGDIIKSARCLKKVKGDHAVRIQERVSEKIQKRLQQIRSFRISDYEICSPFCHSTVRS